MTRPRTFDPEAPILVIDIGNTTTSVATWQEDQLKTPLSVETGNESAFDEVFTAHAEAMGPSGPAAVVVASVVPSALEMIRKYVEERTGQNALVIGVTIPLPMDVAVEDTKAIGVDRVCAAAAVYDKLETACIIVDFGSAVTVDLVNDEGTLLGGAILPGLEMQLRALHEYTAVLPEVPAEVPESPYGRNTVEAMQTGVCRGLAGAVRGLVEGYATALNRWPQVIATGGDLATLAPHCDFLDTPVKDLTLRGVALAFTKHLAAMGA
jgi:type III pantothenate kinase